MKIKEYLLNVKTKLFIKRFQKRHKRETNIFYIGGGPVLPEPFSKEQEEECFCRLLNGDDKAREELIVHNLRLVVYIAKKFENSGVNPEDLVSIGTIGLIKAVKTFCPNKKIKLATYASRCVENEILMYLRKTANRKLNISMDEPLNVDWDGNELLLSDVLTTGPDAVSADLESEDEIRVLRLCISRLTEREQLIIKMRFGLGGYREYTQKEVAEVLSISQSYISRIEKKIIENLRDEISRENAMVGV